MKAITEHSYISLGIVITVVGLVYWAAGVANHTEANAGDIRRLERVQEEFYRVHTQELKEIDQTLSEIRADIKVLKTNHR